MDEVYGILLGLFFGVILSIITVIIKRNFGKSKKDKQLDDKKRDLEIRRLQREMDNSPKFPDQDMLSMLASLNINMNQNIDVSMMYTVYMLCLERISVHSFNSATGMSFLLSQKPPQNTDNLKARLNITCKDFHLTMKMLKDENYSSPIMDGLLKLEKYIPQPKEIN